MIIAIIPARGKSKRIPRKNIKEFCGKPMIAWSIEKALESKIFDRVIVSTDDKSIAKIAEKYGAEVPFLRPSNLSDDYTGTIPVIKHAVNWALDNIGPIDLVCTIYATAPFLEVSDLSKGLKILNKNNFQVAFSVTSFDFPIQRALKINKNLSVSMFQPENYNQRSQDLEPAYHDAGQFYWLKTDAILNEVSTFSEKSLAIILPRYRVQDIDTEEDWIRAELMFKSLNKI
tara:strand:+ start:2548 stop:3237 length:690 start_codon:yes stop_codon:yes gene_type:complete